MRLELGTFPVREATFGARTGWRDGHLEIDRDELLALARGDGITFADVALARPGEPVRIINLTDVVEPRVKVDGPGVVYPGLCGRPVETVGRGRTHRLGGCAVVECAGPERGQARGQRETTPSESSPRGQIARRQDFVDMAGPGAVRPYAGLINLVLTLEADPNLNVEDRHLATHGATLRVADRLAATVAQLDPPEREVFDLTTRAPALPGIVFIPLLASHEFWAGPDSKVGHAVYGVTRLSAPWILHPTELMDGAVSQGTSWPLINNPLVMDLARRHGRELNFLAVIVHRSNWGGQAEMELAAYRDAQAAALLGARGAIVTTNIRGRRFVDVVATIRACEAEGIRTVLVTEEEDSEGGAATPLLINDPAVVAAVSTGTGGVPAPFSPVTRVLGARDPAPAWYGELPPLPGRYGAHHIQDHYGYGRQSCADY
jgi:glycine reductase